MGDSISKGGSWRLHWFFSITLIAFVIAVACFVEEAESARESKSVKSSKSNKEKVKLSGYAIMKGTIFWKSNAGHPGLCLEGVRSNGYGRALSLYSTRFTQDKNQGLFT